MNGPAPEKLRDPAIVDFGVDERGVGRRLERLGGLLVDRPLPQTEVFIKKTSRQTASKAATTQP